MLSSSPSEGTPAVGSYGCTPQSLPKFQHPSHELLKENGFTQHVYHKYRRRCLNGGCAPRPLRWGSSASQCFAPWQAGVQQARCPRALISVPEWLVSWLLSLAGVCCRSEVLGLAGWEFMGEAACHWRLRRPRLASSDEGLNPCLGDGFAGSRAV